MCVQPPEIPGTAIRDQSACTPINTVSISSQKKRLYFTCQGPIEAESVSHTTASWKYRFHLETDAPLRYIEQVHRLAAVGGPTFSFFFVSLPPSGLPSSCLSSSARSFAPLPMESSIPDVRRELAVHINRTFTRDVVSIS